MKESIKKRIEAVRRGEVPEGYDETAAGIIPADWSNTPLSAISEAISETAGYRNFETLSISAGIGFVNQAEKFGKELSGKQYAKYTILRRGDFAYNKGNSKRYPQGCTYMLKEREDAVVPNVFECFRIICGQPEYYEQLFIHGFMNKQLTRKINHGVRDDGLLNLTEEDFYSTDLPVPPFTEQQKIAEILATCDRMIELKQSKIDELNKLKQVCLLEMFPQKGQTIPKRRFPGFSAPWEQRKLTDFVDFYAGLTYTPSDVQETGTLVLRSSNVSNGEIVDADNVYVCPEVVNVENVQVGDIIVVVRNGSRSLIGKHAQIKRFMPNTVIGAFMTGIRSECPEFTNALLNTPHFDEEISLNMGATINQITGYMFSKMEFHIPDLDEQNKIGEFFEKLDNLITLHQRELAEVGKYKKALMQLLLTGLVRVNA